MNKYQIFGLCAMVLGFGNAWWELTNKSRKARDEADQSLWDQAYKLGYEHGKRD